MSKTNIWTLLFTLMTGIVTGGLATALFKSAEFRIFPLHRYEEQSKSVADMKPNAQGWYTFQIDSPPPSGYEVDPDPDSTYYVVSGKESFCRSNHQDKTNLMLPCTWSTGGDVLTSQGSPNRLAAMQFQGAPTLEKVTIHVTYTKVLVPCK